MSWQQPPTILAWVPSGWPWLLGEGRVGQRTPGGTSWQTGNETKAAAYRAPTFLSGDACAARGLWLVPKGCSPGRRTSQPRLPSATLGVGGAGEEDPCRGETPPQAQPPWEGKWLPTDICT